MFINATPLFVADENTEKNGGNEPGGDIGT